MPVPKSYGNCQYTLQTATGTFTLPISQLPSPPPAKPGVDAAGAYYGAVLTALGTAPVLSVYDVVGTNSTLLMQGTGSAQGQVFTPGPPGLGIRPQGALVYVTSGTAAGSWLNLWD